MEMSVIHFVIVVMAIMCAGETIHFSQELDDPKITDDEATNTTTVNEQDIDVQNTDPTAKSIVNDTNEPTGNKLGLLQDSDIHNKDKNQPTKGKREVVSTEKTLPEETTQTDEKSPSSVNNQKTGNAKDYKGGITTQSSLLYDKLPQSDKYKGNPHNNEEVDVQSNKHKDSTTKKPKKPTNSQKYPENSSKYQKDGNHTTNSKRASTGKQRSATEDRQTEKTNCNELNESNLADTKDQEDSNNGQAAESNVFPVTKNMTVSTNTPSSTTKNMNTTASTVPKSTTPDSKTLSTPHPTNSTAKPPQKAGGGRWKKVLNIFGQITCVFTLVGGAFYLIYSVM